MNACSQTFFFKHATDLFYHLYSNLHSLNTSPSQSQYCTKVHFIQHFINTKLYCPAHSHPPPLVRRASPFTGVFPKMSGSTGPNRHRQLHYYSTPNPRLTYQLVLLSKSSIFYNYHKPVSGGPDRGIFIYETFCSFYFYASYCTPMYTSCYICADFFQLTIKTLAPFTSFSALDLAS